MFKFLAKASPFFLTVLITGIGSNYVYAQTEPDEIVEQIEQYTEEDRENNLEQVTNVNQLRDVSPTDWSYEALRSSTERYGCISGLPDGTFRGDRPITRNEFAAGLNSCFQQIERSINSPSSQSYLDSLQAYFDSLVFWGFPRRIIEEDGSISTISDSGKDIESELATFVGEEDQLESRIDVLEYNQFSPTTKLTGETVFSFSNTFQGF